MNNTNVSDKLTASDFVHLHNHTQYSLLDGLTKVPALLDRVQELGMKAVAMTDHGTMSGAIEFYKEATSRGIKPIIGMETYVASRSLTDKDPSKDKLYHHLILLAMNNTGYKNLMRLSTIANLQGFYYKPRIDKDILEKYNDGLIVLSGCIGGEVGDLLRQEQYSKAQQVALWYKKVFGDRYYLELQDHGHKKHPHAWSEQIKVNNLILKLSEELSLQCVVTSDAHYLNHEDQEAHEILLCVQTGSFLNDERRMSLKQFDLFVTDPTDVVKRWGKDHPDFIANTSRIADRCNLKLELGKILIPKFPVPKGESERSYLEKLVYRGLAERYGNRKSAAKNAKANLPDNVRDRAEYELRVIEQMGFCGYFLIISDFINWGKNQGIVFGPGRGSAAGSIIAYGLRITELDPLKYDLLFERFLNPDRISMPDIDIDIQDTRRDEVIQYCVKKYGEDRVANIVTFGRMAARNAVRDVARVLQVPYSEADRVAKMIPPPVQGRHIPLAKSLVDDQQLKTEYESNEQSQRVFDLAMRLEGTIRSHGVHAAGVVIAPEDIVLYTPLEKAQKGVIATQYSMGPIEDLGLLKMDFLGLSNLTIIKNTLRIIKKVYGADIDIDNLELDDTKTYELLARGDTTGVFQFESAGMKRYLRELKPTVFEDIVAMGALYRPGPLSAGLTDSFIKRKNGEEAVSYGHPKMRAALESTYGVLVYQEQFMQISRDVCGFTGGEADTLRKAIGKKNRDIMAKMEKRFIDGAVENGIDKDFIESFWKQLLGFADYCFNKSHSACYGMIAYQTAYLKANYPVAFMAALMTSDFDNIDRLAIEINECRHMGIEVLLPDVNQSFVEFAVVPASNQIRFGMAAIKNVGTGAVEEILRARVDGPFSSLEDFLGRVSPRIVNRKALESLVKTGALDNFGDRSVMSQSLDLLTAFASRLHKETNSGQTGLFGIVNESSAPKLVLKTPSEMPTLRDQLQWERELLGLFLSQHPLEAYELFFQEQTIPLTNLKASMDGKSVTVGGMIEEIREITTKNGQKMAFVKISDLDSETELILFPSVYQQTTGIWEKDRIVLAKGKINARDRDGNLSTEVKILVNDCREVTHEQASGYRPTGKKRKIPEASKSAIVTPAVSKPIDIPRVYIRLQNSQDNELLISLKEAIDGHRGDTEVVLVLGGEVKKQIIKLPVRMSSEVAALNRLQTLVGETNVILQ